MIGLLGGTFDPIHNGHLLVAKAVLEQTAIKRIIFIPCHCSPHRDFPQASPSQRLAMIELAIKETPAFSCSAIELEQDPPSYTINTLKQLTNQHPNETYAWIMGLDAFALFNHWKEYESILSYAHLIVLNRPSETDSLSNEMQQFHQNNAHKIQMISMPPCAISATHIREKISNGESISDLVPSTVNAYIQQHHLYQP